MSVRKLYIVWTAVIGAAVACSASVAEPDVGTLQVPGVVIAHYPKSDEKYVGSPGIVEISSGVYLAKHDEFGPQSTEHTSAVTHLYRSDDAGKHWRRIHTFQGLFWASIFSLDDDLYLLGTDKHHGRLVAMRSRDQGATWTEPTDARHGLLRTGANHTAPVPIVVHNGRVWRAVEDAAGGTKWGVRYRAMMMSAPVTADLLDAASWTFTNFLPPGAQWLDGGFNAWLEGNAVVAPDGDVVNVLRVDYRQGEKAAIARVRDDGRTLSFDPEHDIIDFPGGATKFTIRFDPQSHLYWTLANPALGLPAGARAAEIRNTLVLASSPDLRTWTTRRTVLHHPDMRTHAFQYVDWQFSGDDLIAVSRTAFDDGLGGAHRYHDANFLTFHRVKNFRD